MNTNPIGYCQCGCGRQTKIATKTRSKPGWIAGQPVPYVRGHNSRYRGGPQTNNEQRWCTRCHQIKALNEFYENKYSRDGLQVICKVCSRSACQEWREKNRVKERRYALKHRLRAKFDMSLDDYDSMLTQQNYVCDICKQPESNQHKGIPRLFSVDHDHSTGQVRGLLCNSCNRALGLLGDCPDRLASALAYLIKHLQ